MCIRDRHSFGLLKIGDAVLMGHSKAAVCDLILVPARDGTAVLQFLAVLFREEAEGKSICGLHKFIGIPLGAYKQECHRLIPEVSQTAPADGHGVDSTVRLLGRGKGPLPGDALDGIARKLRRENGSEVRHSYSFLSMVQMSQRFH